MDRVRPSRSAVATWRVDRSRLAAQVAAGLQQGGVVLHADAGYGKTVLLEQALPRPGPVAWVRCGPDDGDPGRLLRRVLEALARAAPGTGEPLRRLLGRPGGPLDAERAMTALVDDLGDVLAEPAVIVLDDAEHVTANPASAGVVQALLEAATRAPLRVALATREIGSLRLARLELGGCVEVFDAGALAFTPAECASMLAAADGAPPDPIRVQALMARTEGWPVAVAIGAAGGEVGPGAPAIERFLDEEVLDPLDPTLRDGLVEASLAPELDAAARTALECPDRLVRMLRESSLFARTPSSDPDTVLLHPLFRELLLARCVRDRPRERVAYLRRRLADALRADGDHVAALGQLLRAGAADDVVAGLPDVAGELARAEPETLRRWIDALGPDHADSPAVREARGRLAWGDGRHEEAAAHFGAAVDGYARAGDDAGVWRARFGYADATYAAGRIAAVPALAEGFERAPGASAGEAVEVAVLAASARAQLGDLAGAEELAARIRSSPHGRGPERAALMDCWERFFVALPRGELDRAVAGCRDAVAILEHADPYARLPYVLGALAFAHEARGEQDAVLAVMDEGERAAADAGLDGHVGALVRMYRAGMCARAGDPAAAEELLARDVVDHGWHAYDRDLTRAAIALQRGAADRAAELVESALEIAAGGPAPSRVRATLLGVPVLVVAGKGDRAAALADAALAALPPEYNPAALLALRGWTAFAAGRAGEAAEDVARSFDAAGPAAVHLVRAGGPLLAGAIAGLLDAGTLAPRPAVDLLLAARADDEIGTRLASHPDATVRRAAVDALSRSGGREDVGRLVALGGDDDARVARAADEAVARLRAHPPALGFRLLGGFATTRAGEPVDAEWERPLARQLVRFLLVRGDAPTPEDELFEIFWPGRDARAARRNLQVTVSNARAVLDVPAGVETRLRSTDRLYRLELRPGDDVDAFRFEHAADLALGGDRLDTAAHERAAALWTGDPLPEDRYEDWAVAWAEGLRSRYAAVLARLADAWLEVGSPDRAAAAARRLVNHDPLDEGAHRRLMRALDAAGHRGQALRQFLVCRRVLVERLGVEPDARTQALHAQILHGR